MTIILYLTYNMWSCLIMFRVIAATQIKKFEGNCHLQRSYFTVKNSSGGCNIITSWSGVKWSPLNALLSFFSLITILLPILIFKFHSLIFDIYVIKWPCDAAQNSMLWSLAIFWREIRENGDSIGETISVRWSIYT